MKCRKKNVYSYLTKLLNSEYVKHGTTGINSDSQIHLFPHTLRSFADISKQHKYHSDSNNNAVNFSKNSSMNQNLHHSAEASRSKLV